MLFSTLFRALRRSPQRAVRTRPSGFRPRLETLEERCVPTTFNVTSNADSLGSAATMGTLRWAVAQAQNGDTIKIQPQVIHYVGLNGSGSLSTTVGQDIVLTQGEIVLNHNVTIESTGPVPTISGDNLSRVFEVAPGANVTLLNLDVTQGNGVANNPGSAQNPLVWDGDGGAILNRGSLVVTDCTVSHSSAKDGGGIDNFTGVGTLLLVGSTVSNNTAADGGGIYNGFGTLNIIGGSIQGNRASGAEGDGGGIYNAGDLSATSGGLASTASVIGCTLSSNFATNGVGGGIYSAGVLSVYNCTLSSNSATWSGGGVACMGGTSTIRGCTIENNSALFGGGIYSVSYSTSVGGCTFWTDGATPISGPFTNASSNSGL